MVTDFLEVQPAAFRGPYHCGPANGLRIGSSFDRDDADGANDDVQR